MDDRPDPIARLRPRRRITGMAAVLLPFDAGGGIDWTAFAAHVGRTAAAGLLPAVNMDTGYVHLLDELSRRAVLERTAAVLGGGPFVAGAFVADAPGDPWRPDLVVAAMEPIVARGGLPIVFPSYGLTALPGPEVVAAHEELARHCDRFLAFELGRQFAPFGAVYDLETYGGLLGIPQCVGAKHSSLRREPEWDRLALRDERRPEFLVLTGNDLAIDMVMYGSDYLLGLATFAPDAFAARDAAWEQGDPRFYELNDALQYLGRFAFRDPVPAYRHSAAQFLAHRGWIASDATPAGAPRRPDTDLDVLREISTLLEALVA
ncbi:MAG TPA: dihydrodipicolinate synthase family protein [Acidimicrobiia bacterium]|nr:dihydrodipicolinate synthase family protein [Acidimicrobiia bacterium]